MRCTVEVLQAEMGSPNFLPVYTFFSCLRTEYNKNEKENHVVRVRWGTWIQKMFVCIDINLLTDILNAILVV